MPRRDNYPEGIPSWVDLSTSDVSAAREFYSNLFGWSYTDEGSDEMPYTMAKIDGASAAGMGPLQDENMPPNWTTYFAVDSADKTAERIREAGGTLLMEPADAFESGRLAIAAAPGGEVFGIWEAKEHIGAEVVNEHGSISWNELMTDDVDTALNFYAQVFGHETRTTDMGGGFMYSTLAAGERQVAGVMAKPDANIPNMWGVYFFVDDTEKALDTMKANGGQVLFGPDTTEGVGVLGGGTDPQGAHFSVMTPEQPPTD